MNFYNLFCADFKSPYKCIWLFSRILITWSFWPDTRELSIFEISYCPDGETSKFSWGFDKWWEKWK